MTKELCSRLNDIDNKLDELQKDMEEILSMINDMKYDLLNNSNESNLKKNVKQDNKIILMDDKSKWKKEVYGHIKILISANRSFKKKSEVLHCIYNYMRRNYGIVWEQDIKEYREYYKIDYKPKTIDIVYNNKMYKSIFEAVLADMIANQSDATKCGAK